MTDMLKCPFCGGEARHYAPGPIEHHIECTNPKCYAVTHGWSTEAEAIAAWNARAERTCRNASLDNSQFYCSMCECTVVMPLLWGELKYCPGCGARVKRGDA